MRLACIAFAVGAWLVQQCAVLPSRTVCLAVLACGLGFAVSTRRAGTWAGTTARVRSVARLLAVVVAGIAIGFGYAALRAQARLAESLPHALEGRDLTITGVVDALPAVGDRATRFTFAVERVHGVDDRGRALDVGRDVPSRIALAWYDTGSFAAASRIGGPRRPSTRDTVLPGQRWRFTVRLKRPHGTANPDVYDVEYAWLEDGIRATGYVRTGVAPVDDADLDDDPRPAAGPPRLIDRFVPSPNNTIEWTRAAIRDRILRDLSGDDGPAPYAGVIVALVVGDQRAIEASDWTLFNRTGIGHLVSISGLHVSMLAALGAWATAWWWRRSPARLGRLPAQKAAALAGFAVALAYCLLAGFGVPAQRTLYMIGTVALALWLHRATSVTHVLCAALLVVLAIDPWAVMAAGFWLSFTAVASIFYVTSGRMDGLRDRDTWMARVRIALGTALRVQWAVTLALTPLTLLFFHQVSLVGPLANAVAIPLVSFAVTPAALAGALLPGTPGAWLLALAHALMAALARWLSWLSDLPAAVWTGAAPGPLAFILAMIGVVWWLAPRGLPRRSAGLLWMLPLFAWPVPRPATGSVWITALDVGQGTAVVIETRTTRLLYDTGPAYGSGSDAGMRIVLPFLRSRGIARIDTLVVSHDDNDHAGGASSVVAGLPVGETLASLSSGHPLSIAVPTLVPCRAGQHWTVDGVRFAMLHPDSENATARPNARSCVLRVEAHGRSLLLTGDIERPQESALVERRPDALASDVLLVPHHGSRTSSSGPFLDAVRPSTAIVQAGYLNRFGHPRADVLARYTERAIDVARTDHDGAILVQIDPGGVSIARYRTSHARYWSDLPRGPDPD